MNQFDTITSEELEKLKTLSQQLKETQLFRKFADCAEPMPNRHLGQVTFKLVSDAYRQQDHWPKKRVRQFACDACDFLTEQVGKNVTYSIDDREAHFYLRDYHTAQSVNLHGMVVDAELSEWSAKIIKLVDCVDQLHSADISDGFSIVYMKRDINGKVEQKSFDMQLNCKLHNTKLQIMVALSRQFGDIIDLINYEWFMPNYVEITANDTNDKFTMVV